MDAKYGSPWSREELILALYLYCQIPFAQTKANNPEVIHLAGILGRTPSSVARKLGNFGAFDPLLAEKGISGLTHYSAGDRSIWYEFSQHWDRLVDASQKLLQSQKAEFYPLQAEELAEKEIGPMLPEGPTERASLVMTRLYQSFFRRSVLSSYNSTCCVCGLDLKPLLVASHIIPWAANPGTRTDPQNGLCLCSLHDKAFDRGLIAVTPKWTVAISAAVLSSKSAFVASSLAAFAQRQIALPSRFGPKPEFLQWHFSHVFNNELRNSVKCWP